MKSYFVWTFFLRIVLTDSSKSKPDYGSCLLSDGWICGFGAKQNGLYCVCPREFPYIHRSNFTNLCTCSRKCHSDLHGLSCGYNAKCSFRPVCECITGYTEINGVCEANIDIPCLSGNHSCIWPEYCVKTNGSYECVCQDGLLEVFCIGSTVFIITLSVVPAVIILIVISVVLLVKRWKKGHASSLQVRNNSGNELISRKPLAAPRIPSPVMNTYNESFELESCTSAVQLPSVRSKSGYEEPVTNVRISPKKSPPNEETVTAISEAAAKSITDLIKTMESASGESDMCMPHNLASESGETNVYEII